MLVSEIVQIDCGGRQSKLADMCEVSPATVFRWLKEAMIVVNGQIYSKAPPPNPKKPRHKIPDGWVLWHGEWYSPRVYRIPFQGSRLPSFEEWQAEQGGRGRREVIDSSRVLVQLSPASREALEQIKIACGVETYDQAIGILLGVGE